MGNVKEVQPKLFFTKIIKYYNYYFYYNIIIIFNDHWLVMNKE